MKFIRIFVLIAASALALTACSNESSDTPTAVVANTNPLLAYVPADTAYVFAALEPAPREITDAYIARFQPVLDVMSDHIKQFQSDYESGEFADSDMARFATAILDELGGTVDSESLAKFGISMQAHHAFYAMGVFPVMRLELSDAQELKDAIGRVEAKMGVTLPVSELNGASYWRIAEDDMPIGLYVAILDQQLAISAFPVGAEGSLLAAFLGQEMPATSIATTNALAIMNSEKGYTGHGSGILDLQKISNEVFDSNSSTRSYMGPEMAEQLASLDAVCIAEMKSMIAKAPRMTAGTTNITANEIAMRYDLEIENSLAAGLAALVSDTPVAEQGDHLLSASLALQIGKLRTFVLEKATAIVATPYQCEMLQELNQNASKLATQLNIPMPPMVNNLKGARIKVNDFDPTEEMPQGDGLLAVYVDKPEMFVGMASMMVPGFDSLDLANQTEPVRIPEEMLHMPGLDLFALMSDNAIGVSIGAQNTKDLGPFLAAKQKDNGTFFSVSHDMAKQWEIQNVMSERYIDDTDGHQSLPHEYSEAFRNSYKELLGRSYVEMRFTTEGLVIDSNMTFK